MPNGASGTGLPLRTRHPRSAQIRRWMRRRRVAGGNAGPAGACGVVMRRARECHLLWVMRHRGLVAMVRPNPARNRKDRNDQRIIQRPVLETLAAMTAESVARCGLDANSLLVARIAALAAVDAPAASYLLHVGPAVDAGVTIEQIQDILVAVAPIVGTPRTVSAA